MGFFSNFFGKKLSETQQQEIKTIITNLKNPLDNTPLDDTDNQENFLSPKAISELKLKKNTLYLTLSLPYPCKSLWSSIEQDLNHELTQLQNIKNTSITFKTEIMPHGAQKNIPPLPNIKNIIAIASGKGGVGKSTTSVNLALALQQEGAQVGILDADIYGPSIPTMLNIKDKPASQDGKIMQPLMAYGLQVMSIGALIEEDSPMIWRGPIVTQTLTQLLKETHWQDLDYLIIDLPPGTGDVQLTLAQQIPVTGAVIITTPQPVSVIDAKKALNMFKKVEIPVLGIIENMATHICSHCQHEEDIFGTHGGQEMAEQYKIKLLGSLPLDKQIREHIDQGEPTVIAEPDNNITQKYRNMAHQISNTIRKQKRNYANVFPKIEILDH